jgi:DNA-binding CsgD family transcriptional regulator
LSIAYLFWVHYRLGFAALIGTLTFPDIVFLSSCLVIIAYILLSFYAKLSNYRSRFAIFGAVCGILSALLTEAPIVIGIPFDLLGSLGASMFAIYLITYCLLWLGVFRKQGITVTVIYILFSVILGCFLAWFSLELYGYRVIWALSVMTALSAATLSTGLKRSSQRNSINTEKDTSVHMPIGFLFTTLAFSISYMYAITVNSLEEFNSVFSWNVLIFSLLLLVLVFSLHKKMTVEALFSLAALLMIVGLLITLFTDIYHIILFDLFSFGYFTYLIFILLFYCGFAKERGGSDLRIACCLVLSIFVGLFIGRFLLSSIEFLFGQQARYYQVLVSVLLICILLVCTIVCLQTIFRIFGNISRHPEFKIISLYKQKHLDCNQITKIFDLSEREAEVLQLLLDGKSATQIAETMVIAHGTAKAHIRNVYKKIDIHRREELFQIASNGMPDHDFDER